MRTVSLGITRTGSILNPSIPYTNDSRFTRDIHGDEDAEIVVPMSELPSDVRKNPSAYFTFRKRFIAISDPQDADLNIPFAGPIQKVELSPLGDKVSIIASSFKKTMSEVPIVPIAKRTRISSDEDVWKLTGSHRGVTRTLLTEILTDDATHILPSSVTLPEALTGSLEFDFPLSEVQSFTDFMNDMASSYDGVEIYFQPKWTTAARTHVTWVARVGTLTEPHIDKNLSPLTVDLDDRNGGIVDFTQMADGTENVTWLFAQSGAYSEEDRKWIDLKSTSVVPSNDPEFISVFKKERFDPVLTPAQLDAQITARLSGGDKGIKSHTISVWDPQGAFLKALGRKLDVTSSVRLPGFTESLRITQVTSGINDPQVELTVLPADLRVYPKLPKNLRDAFDNANDKALKNDAWKTPVTGLPSWGGGDIPLPEIPDDWDTPNVIDQNVSATEKSPFGKSVFILNEIVNRGTGATTGTNRLTSGMWGLNTFTSAPSFRNIDIGPDGSTVIPHPSNRRFYGLSWSALILKHDLNVERLMPYKLEIYKTRQLTSYPTVTPSSQTYTDETVGVTGTGGKIGEISSSVLLADLLQVIPPAEGYSLHWERLASGSFIRGLGANQKLVIYVHQLQLWTGEATWSRSKGVAFEIGIHQTTGDLVGEWTPTAYPFDVEGDALSFYPTTAQTDAYGVNREFVSCVTPVGYYKNKKLNVTPPAIVSNTYWEDIKMGQYAVQDAFITHSYFTGDTIKKDGPAPSIFNPREKTDDRWNESFQLYQFGGELWVTNETYKSYWADKKMASNEQRWLAMRFLMKALITIDGTPSTWHMLASQYGFTVNPQAYGYHIYPRSTSQMVGFKGLVLGGTVDSTDLSLPSSENPYLTSLTIAGKVGAVSARVIYTPTATPAIQNPNSQKDFFYYSTADSGSGPVAEPFFSDFYDLKISPERGRGDEARWFQTADYIVPRYGGGDNGHRSMTTGRLLEGASWVVSAGRTSSYLLYSGATDGFGAGNGESSSWQWFSA